MKKKILLAVLLYLTTVLILTIVFVLLVSPDLNEYRWGVKAILLIAVGVCVGNGVAEYVLPKEK